MTTDCLCILTRFGSHCPYTPTDPAAAYFSLFSHHRCSCGPGKRFSFPDTRAALVSVPLFRFLWMNRVTERWERDGQL